MIYWLCPKPGAPSGGVLVIHHFAHILDTHGIPSRVIQAEPFEVWWDAEPVPEYIYKERDTFIHDALRDNACVTVIPETLWHAETEKAPWCNPVMMCQNWMWLDKRLPLKGAKVVVCSRHLSNYLQREYEGADVIGIVRPFVNGAFTAVPRDAASKRQRVLIISRRNSIAGNLRDFLTKLDYEVDFVDQPLTQKEIATHLQGADYYAHLVSPEGWPQACLEAMRCGTVVVGTPGGSGVEFMFHKETAMVVQDGVYGHITEKDMVYQIASALNELRDTPELKESIRAKAIEWSKRYTEEATAKELLAVFGGMA